MATATTSTISVTLYERKIINNTQGWYARGGGTIHGYMDYTITNANDKVSISITYGYKLTVATEGNGQVVALRNGVTTKVAGTGQTTKSVTDSDGATIPLTKGKVLACQQGSFTWSWNRSTTAQTKTVTLSVTANSSTKSKSITVSVPILPSYAITYDTNGGTPTLNKGTKYYGINYTAFSARPSLSKCTCMGWTTTKYSPSSSGASSYVTTYTSNAAATFYAYYIKNYYSPSITNISTTRCLPNGTEDIMGEALKISYICTADTWKYSSNKIASSTLTIKNAAGSSTLNSNTFSSINAQTTTLTYQYPAESAFYSVVSSPDASSLSDYYEIIDGHYQPASGSFDSSKTYYTYNTNVGLDPELQYQIVFTATDNTSESSKTTTITITTPLINFPLDIAANGKSIGLFMPAPDNTRGLYVGSDFVQFGLNTGDYVAFQTKTRTTAFNAIQIYDTNTTYGQNIRIGAGGNIIIGAGESSTGIYNTSSPVDSATDSGENLYLAADVNIYFYSKCDSIGNRLKMTFDNAGDLTIPKRLIMTKGQSIRLGGASGSYIYSYDNSTTNLGCIGYNAYGTAPYHAFWTQPSNGSQTGRLYITETSVYTANNTPFTSAGKLTVSNSTNKHGALIYGTLTVSGAGASFGGAVTVSSGNLNVSSGNITASGVATFTGTATTDYSANARFGTSSPVGRLYRSTASSRRFKHEIQPLTKADLDPHKLYGLPIRQFKYNMDYLDFESPRFGLTVPGFIAEEMYDVYPIAVDLDSERRPEDWNIRYVIPPMLALIQEQHQEIEELKERISILEEK